LRRASASLTGDRRVPTQGVCNDVRVSNSESLLGGCLIELVPQAQVKEPAFTFARIPQVACGTFRPRPRLCWSGVSYAGTAIRRTSHRRQRRRHWKGQRFCRQPGLFDFTICHGSRRHAQASIRLGGQRAESDSLHGPISGNGLGRATPAAVHADVQ